MSFEAKYIIKKPTSSYKTIYLKDNIIKQIDKIAKDNDTSFNNVIVSMIETCLNNEITEKEKIG